MTRRQTRAAAREARRARRIRSPRGPVPPLRPRSDRRSITIGIVGALVLHLVLLVFGPKMNFVQLGTSESGSAGREREAPSYDVEFLPSDFEPEPPPPQNFVEVNPDAPENIPDQTINFGAQNQQVAQEEPTPGGESESPASQSDQDEAPESTALVSGNRQEPAIPVIAPPPMADDAPEDMADLQFTDDPALARPATVAPEVLDPLEGLEDDMGDSEDGVGTRRAPPTENARDVEERVEGVQEDFDPTAVPGTENAPAVYFRPDPNRPLQRPQLAGSQLRPAFIANRVDGTANMGVIAHRALKTEYGEYLNRIIDTVDIQWNTLIRRRLEARVGFPLDGSRVKVEFVLHQDGSVSISNVEGSAGDLWNRVAVDAVASRSPYGEWSEDMVTILGERTSITFTFHY